MPLHVSHEWGGSGTDCGANGGPWDTFTQADFHAAAVEMGTALWDSSWMATSAQQRHEASVPPS